MKIYNTYIMGALFLFTLIFLGLGPSPFSSLTSRIEFQEENSNFYYNLMFFALFIIFCLILILKHSRIMISLLNPMLYLHILWMVLGLFIIGDFIFNAKKLILIIFTFVIFAIAPLLPKDEKHFQSLMGYYCLTVLVLCFMSVIVFPGIGIHQTNDLSDSNLVGSWRGFYIHKNTAGFNIALVMITGFYVIASNRPLVGLSIVALSLIFLLFSGAKTSLGLVFPSILFGYLLLIQKNKFINLVIILITTLAIHFFVLGSYLFPEVKEALLAINIDTSFTGRTEIWNYILYYVNQNPIYGSGLATHWNLPEVKFADEAHSWVASIGSSHNGFIEISLSNGYPMVFFFLLFAYITPIMSYFNAVKLNGNHPLITYFMQIWFFALASSSTESAFYGTGTGWGLFVLSIFGLYYLSKFPPQVQN